MAARRPPTRIRPGPNPRVKYMIPVEIVPPNIKRLSTRLRRYGPESLSPKECCDLVSYQLGEIARWQQAIYDKIWGNGGGGTPPPPPTWPPS